MACKVRLCSIRKDWREAYWKVGTGEVSGSDGEVNLGLEIMLEKTQVSDDILGMKIRETEEL